jgi:hypothetical protein
MNKLFSLITMLLIVALFALPLSAQESTQEAPVIVIDAPIVESPETGDLSEIELVLAGLFLVSLLFNALQAFWGAKSIPPELAMQIFSGARLLANISPSPDDNKLVDAGERFYQDLSQLKAQEPIAKEEKPRD